MSEAEAEARGYQRGWDECSQLVERVLLAKHDLYGVRCACGAVFNGRYRTNEEFQAWRDDHDIVMLIKRIVDPAMQGKDEDG